MVAAHAQAHALHDVIIIPENAPWVGSDKAEVFVSQQYFSPEDVHGYTGVFADYDFALRVSGRKASVLNYLL